MSGIDWSKYLAYFTEVQTRQRPLPPPQRAAIGTLLEEALGFAKPDGHPYWGTAGGFGNGTEVVIQLHAAPKSALVHGAAESLGVPLAIRLMRQGRGQRTIPFHIRRAATGKPLNGRENVHFQRSIAVVHHRGRDFLIHEWVPGETLEWLRKNRWELEPLRGECAEKILRQILLGIVIPAWAEATESSGVVWDIRDANFVVSNYEQADSEIRVTYVDTGNLRCLVDLQKNREGQIRNGLQRLKATMQRVLKAQGKWKSRPINFVRRYVAALEQCDLLGALEHLPGAKEGAVEKAIAAAEAFIVGVRECGLLRP